MLERWMNEDGRVSPKEGVTLGYDLHIERISGHEEGGSITLAEWREVTAQSDRVRPVVIDAYQHENPHTGEVISIASSDGDLEVRLQTGEWVPAIFWQGTRGTIPTRSLALNNDDPVWSAAADIARRLDAA